MKVCPNCFSDSELKSYIQTSSSMGKCSVCNSPHVPLLNVAELEDFFISLVACFEYSKDGSPIPEILTNEWKLFSTQEYAAVILTEFVDAERLNLSVDYIEDIKKCYAHWDIFKQELKEKRRFISDTDRLIELGWDGSFNKQYDLTPDTVLYRARVHHQSGMDAYNKSKMSCPPLENTTAGRANPLGIPYLYLSDNKHTVLYEVRASYLDELSVGTFSLKEEHSTIKIVDFSDDLGLFSDGSIESRIKSQLLIREISEDLSKPMRRYDSELDYIPTQFICEFIKLYTGAQGIRFKSSLHSAGNNIVLFDQDLMECKDVHLMKISSLDLESESI